MTQKKSAKNKFRKVSERTSSFVKDNLNKDELIEKRDKLQKVISDACFNKENAIDITNKVLDTTKAIGEKSFEKTAVLTKKAGKEISTFAQASVDKVKNIDLEKYRFDMEDVLKQLLKIPAFQIDRGSFLRKELKNYYPEKTISLGIERNPAYAGVDRKTVNKIAKEVINYETNKVSVISFAAGLPGGLAMAAAIPTDIIQYFGNMLVVTQKLAYLYGFDDLGIKENEVNDTILNELMIFFGVMFGIQGANATLKVIADATAAKVAKSLSQKALTKTTIYPIVKSTARIIGVKMTKEIFAKNVSKAVPIVGGVVSGSITYATFKPSANRLKKRLEMMNISNPEFYKDFVENIA